MLGAGVATTDLIQQFEDSVMTLAEAPALEGHRAVVQRVQKGLAIITEGAVGEGSYFHRWRLAL